MMSPLLRPYNCIENNSWFLGRFFGKLSSLQRGVWVHKNSLTSCQRCRHSVDETKCTAGKTYQTKRTAGQILG